jgi:hypothetical protein
MGTFSLPRPLPMTEMLISRQLTPFSITSPRQQSSLVAVVRDEEARHPNVALLVVTTVSQLVQNSASEPRGRPPTATDLFGLPHRQRRSRRA